MNGENQCAVLDRRRWALGALIVGVALARGYAVWTYRHDTSLDVAMTTLMARHMATGERFPVFFYGQEYSGTLESVFGAAVIRVLGDSQCAANLGAALLAALALPAAFSLARRLGGMRAGAVAVALLAVGPSKFFAYHASAQSYAQILTLSLAIPAVAAALLARWSRGDRASIGSWFGFGALIGLGHWTHPLVWSAALASVLALAAFGRRRLFVPAAGAAPAGFLLGSAPWWVWNVGNGFASLRGPGGPLFDTARAVLPRLAHPGIAQVFGLENAPGPVRAAAWAALATVLGYAIAQSVREARRPSASPPGRRQTRLLLLACIAVHVALVAISAMARFRSPGRYLTIVFPAFAVLAGGITADWTSRSRYLGWLPAAALLALQIPELPRAWRKQCDDRAARQFALDLRGVLRANGIEAVYVNFWADVWLNNALGGEFVFWPVDGMLRHPPLWERIERAERVAVLGEDEEVRRLQAALGGSCDAVDIGGRRLYFNFRKESDGRRAIPSTQWRTDADGGGAGDPLGDRLWRTAWDAPAPPGGDAYCEADFERPRLVCGARLILETPHRYFHWQLWGRSEAGEPWQPLTDEQMGRRLEWSGDRPFTAGRHAVLEARFPPQHLAALRIRIRQHRAESRPRRIVELQLFAPDEPAPNERERWPDLARAIAEAGGRRVYAGRWIGYALESAGFAVVRGDPYTADLRDTRYDPHLELSRDTVLVVREEDAELTVSALSRAGVTMQTQRVAPWVLFHFEPAAWRAAYAGNRSLRWVGVGCLFDAE